MISLIPSTAQLETLTEPWRTHYEHAARRGAATLSAILEQLAGEAGVPGDQLESRRLAFLPEAKRLAEEWLALEATAGGEWRATTELERLFKEYAISVARMQSAIDDAAMHAPNTGSVH